MDLYNYPKYMKHAVLDITHRMKTVIQTDSRNYFSYKIESNTTPVT